MSDQYTPTTEQVREAWVEFARNRLNPKRRFVLGWAGLTRNVIDTAFDRWLRQVKAEAWDEALQETATWIEGGTSRNYGPEYDSPMDRALIAVIDTLRTAPNFYRKEQTDE